jgi:predicted phage terminase large subunit-like protein
MYGLERMTVIASAEEGLALGITRHLLELVRENEQLRRLYGPFTVAGGPDEFTIRWRQRRSSFVAKSFRTQIRGVNVKGQRPTRIIVDDGERSDLVRNPEQRAFWWRLLHDDILKAGPSDGGLLVEVLGTVLHPDSMLANLLKTPGWAGQKWQAVKRWPDRQDLWETCGRLWKNLRLGDSREAAARTFYAAHRAEMDAGVEVLDPHSRPIWSVYELIWSEGLASVLKELQNEPRDPSTQFFDSSRFARCKVVGDEVIAADGHRVRVSDLLVSLRLDPIPGDQLGGLGQTGSGASDYAAIAALGRDSAGYGYVLDLWLRRARDTEQLAAFWSMAEKWRAQRGSIEANGFQRLLGRDFRREQVARKEAGKYWQIAVEDDVSTTSKEDRIASLDAPTSNGWLQFAEGIPLEALQQFDEFPTGSHDDAPDAVEGAWRKSVQPRRAA